METSYKEKYEQALAHAREIHRNEEEKRSDMEWLFPELKESGDEKVRKTLIKFFSMGAKNNSHTYDIADKDIIAWLEKQGEKHPDPYNGISFEYNGHIWGMCARDNGVDISCDKHLIKHLEKQGQVKESAISQHENRTCEENGNSLTSEDAIEREVKEDAGGYPYIDATELYDYENDKPLAKAGDRVKVVFIKDK